MGIDLPEPVSQRRGEYARDGLHEAQAGPDPLVLFDAWYREAVEEQPEPAYAASVVTLATVTAEGWPDARIVLLKEYGESGFVFFTNYASCKAQQMEARPRAALVFHWLPLERQVRVRGPVERVSRAESEAYFATRPRGSQLSAWASSQSETVTRRELEQRLAELERRWEGRHVDCPPHWGGYRLRAEAIEFWQGRPDRLHDRLLYERAGTSGAWTRSRLAP